MFHVPKKQSKKKKTTLKNIAEQFEYCGVWKTLWHSIISSTIGMGLWQDYHEW